VNSEKWLYIPSVFIVFAALGFVVMGHERMSMTIGTLFAAEDRFRGALKGNGATRSSGLELQPTGEDTAWGRNPFLTPEEEARGGRPATQGLVIQTIIIGHDKSVATLGGRTVEVGDRIGEEMVVEIRRDAVVLEKNGRRRILRAQELSRVTTGVRSKQK